MTMRTKELPATAGLTMTPAAKELLGRFIPYNAKPNLFYRQYVEYVLNKVFSVEEIQELCRSFGCDVGAVVGRIVRHQMEKA